MSARPFRSAFPLDGGAATPEQILAFHRAHFGATQMNDATSGAEPGAAGGAAGGTAPAPAAAATAPTAQAPTATAETGKVEDLPEWAQKIIRDSRDEAGKARTTAKANAAASSDVRSVSPARDAVSDAEAAQWAALAKGKKKGEIAKEIGKALGLVKDDETPDPAKLTEQLTATQAQARQAAIELAVYKAAGKHSGDPVAILDSRAFLASVTDLDPNGSDFTSAVDAAIKAAVDGNPKLKATAPAAGASTVQHAGGSGEGAVKPKTLDEAIAKKMAQ